MEFFLVLFIFSFVSHFLNHSSIFYIMDNQKQLINVSHFHQDRQWDARFNIPDDVYLFNLVQNISAEADRGRFKYILVSGVEIGTRPEHDDYGLRHVHVAVIFHNRTSKSAILKNWGINEEYGYYLVPRNRQLPYSGWRKHHIKEFSKEDPSKLITFEDGELPVDIKQKKLIPPGPEEKKRKLDEILVEMKGMIENNQDEECFAKFPRNYLTYGEKIKAMINQKRDFFKEHGDPNIWLYGFAGTGKTAILAFVYPHYYKKNLTNRFFDLYDPKEHTHVMLEDLDHEAVERLGINFLKTICDEAGFPIDQKYKTPQIISTTCLITSNFTIPEILQGMQNQTGLEQNKAALMRRFYHVRVDNLLHLLGLKLIPKWDLSKLRKEGNTNMGRLFITWDYVADVPLCTPVREPGYYQELIRNHYYQ